MVVRYATILLLVTLTASPLLSQNSTEREPQEANRTLSTPDSLSRAVANLYEHVTSAIYAEAERDFYTQEAHLDSAMVVLTVLAVDSAVTSNERYRQVYQTVVAEYESYYGAVDTLGLIAGDIENDRKEVFEAIEDSVVLKTNELPKLQPMKTTITMDMNRLVEQSLIYLLRTQDDILIKWRQRAPTYMPMIERILEEEGVPDEMKYLAMVESGLNPTAKSWARAGGMWQFIKATGNYYGLEVNSYVDERMDPEKATRAAARHLKDLYRQFGGDWHLAMSGYNCSPARVKRAIRKARARLGRTPTFWDIYKDLPRETRNYVPMYIAASLLISNESEFNLKPIEPAEAFAYDHVALDRVITLSEAARMAGVTTAAIKTLNPEIKTEFTPPYRGTYMLRVPVGSGDRFTAAFEANKAKEPGLIYTVRSGDTISKIAKSHNTSVAAIQKANGMRSKTVKQGRELKIPMSSYKSSMAAEVADFGARTVKYETRSVQPILVSSLRGPSAKVTEPENITAVALTAERRAKDLGTISKKAAPKKKTTTAKKSTSNRVRYKVRRGDTLGGIGRKYGVSVSSLKSWNKLRGTKIRIGQRLTVYPGKKAQASSSSSSTYRVRKGDSLFSIGMKYGLTVTRLKKLNGLRSNTIRPGQRLKVK